MSVLFNVLFSECSATGNTGGAPDILVGKGINRKWPWVNFRSGYSWWNILGQTTHRSKLFYQFLPRSAHWVALKNIQKRTKAWLVSSHNFCGCHNDSVLPSALPGSWSLSLMAEHICSFPQVLHAMNPSPGIRLSKEMGIRSPLPTVTSCRTTDIMSCAKQVLSQYL